MTTYNFCAGPAMLPVEVMAQAQQEFVNWQGQGCSVMELSHRSKPFIKVAADAEQDLRDLLAIPANYKVLFMHGGGRGQFSAVPLNLLKSGQSADYFVSGAWSSAAVEEGTKFGQVRAQDIRVKNADGNRIGGRYLVAASAEYQYSIAEKWRLATFVDQGNSFNSLELPSLKTGVGFGVRWVSPVGPLRLDLAKALDDDGGIRLHFSMGPEL